MGQTYHVGLSSTLLRLEEDGLGFATTWARLVDARQLSRINVSLKILKPNTCVPTEWYMWVVVYVQGVT